MHWKSLVSLANGKARDETRAMAVRALGLVREPLLKKPIARWLGDAAPAVRTSAVLLLAAPPLAISCSKTSVSCSPRKMLIIAGGASLAPSR